MRKKSKMSSIIISCLMTLLPLSATIAAQGPSFVQMAATPGWKISPINFKASTQTLDHIFFIRISQGLTIGFEGRDISKKNEKEKRFGPVRSDYISILFPLLDYGLETFGSSRQDIKSINLNWELYPEKIARWAQVWQTCPLAQENWKLQNLEAILALKKKIAQVVKKDMTQVVARLGFEITGVDMEKIFHFKAGKLLYYKTHLKPMGIPAELEIPIPMMLYLVVRATDPSPVYNNTPVTAYNFTPDAISATASKESSNVYFSFNRQLNRYDLSGDRLEKDGEFTRLKIMQDDTCRIPAFNLLNAGFQLTGAERQNTIFLKTDLELFPDAFTKLIKRIQNGPPFQGLNGFTRPEMPDDMNFYRYIPAPETQFSGQIDPFLHKLGYRFSHLELSFVNNMKAGRHPYFKTLLKPSGIGPEDMPWLPYIVYMAIKKN